MSSALLDLLKTFAPFIVYYVSEKRKIARAEEVLLMLGLKDCAEMYVGGELLKGISGGEKRRLSLAVQMLNDPSVVRSRPRSATLPQTLLIVGDR